MIPQLCFSILWSEVLEVHDISNGSHASRAAAQRVLEGGRVPDDATVDVFARRIAAGGPAAEGGADLSVYDGFLRGGGAHARWRRARAEGRGGRQEVLAHDLRAQGVGGRRQPEAGRVPGGVPRGRGGEPRRLQARTPLRRCGLPAPKTFDGYDWSAVSWPEGLGREDLLPLSSLERREDLVLMGGVGTGKTHMASAPCQLACDRRLEARFFTASTLVMRLRRAREEGRLDREMSQVARARLLVIDELGFLPLDADGARLVFQVFADAYERQSVVITTNLDFSRWGGVFGDDQMAAAVIDRVVHHGRLVQFRGESHRVRHALMQEG